MRQQLIPLFVSLLIPTQAGSSRLLWRSSMPGIQRITIDLGEQFRRHQPSSRADLFLYYVNQKYKRL